MIFNIISYENMQNYSTKEFVYLIKLQISLNIKHFFIKMHKQLQKHIDDSQIIPSTFQLVYQNLIRLEKRLLYQCQCKKVNIVQYLFNFVIVVQEDSLLTHYYFKNKPICQFIINKFGIERFMALDMKKFNDAKYIICMFLQETDHALLKFVKGYLSVVIKFHIPFNSLGIQQFWREFNKGYNGQNCCQDISKFIQRFNLQVLRLKEDKQKRSLSMTLLYVLYLWYSFKSFNTF